FFTAFCNYKNGVMILFVVWLREEEQIVSIFDRWKASALFSLTFSYMTNPNDIEISLNSFVIRKDWPYRFIGINRKFPAILFKKLIWVIGRKSVFIKDIFNVSPLWIRQSTRENRKHHFALIYFFFIGEWL